MMFIWHTNLRGQMEKDKKKQKPGFFSWILHSPNAFKVLSMMSIFMGLLITVLMTIAAFVFDYHVFFKVVFSLMTFYQITLTIRAWIMRDAMVNTVHNFTYKGDFKGKQKKEVKK